MASLSNVQMLDRELAWRVVLHSMNGTSPVQARLKRHPPDGDSVGGGKQNKKN